VVSVQRFRALLWIGDCRIDHCHGQLARLVELLSGPRFRYNGAKMNPQLQLWMPAVLSLFGTLSVVMLTAWLNTKMLSVQVESVRAELRSEMKAMEERIGRQLAELELRLSKQIMELSQWVERLEEARGLVRP